MTGPAREPLLWNISRDAARIAFVVTCLFVSWAMWDGAVQSQSVDQLRMKAPIGHRQPTAKSVPRSVQREENAVKQEDMEIDKDLNICRGC